MGAFRDISGQMFGRLTAIKKEKTDTFGGFIWFCKCSCGNSKKVRSGDLIGGNTKSCGCLKSEATRESNTKHGLCGSPAYVSWAGMIARCTNKKTIGYKNYGGRGISVCAEWSEFSRFHEDMGDPPGDGFSLDRINNDGNYEPGNCRWATKSQQAKNRRKRVTRI